MPAFRRMALAALFSALWAAPAAYSSTMAAGCADGELTLERVAASDCAARIPVPTARPDPQTASFSSARRPAETSEVEWEFIETSGSAPGETRLVRLVGSRFLPDRNEAIDFRSLSASNVDLVNALFQRAAAYFMNSEPTVAAKSAELETFQEARVRFEPRMLRR